MRASISFCSALTLVALAVAASFGQVIPPASIVPEPYRQKFVYYVDRRSISEKVLNLVGLTSQDVGRSFALIAGVSKYPNMPDLDRELPAAAADIDELQDYLKNQEFFDEIVVLRDGDVNLENLQYFLEDYFPDRVKQSPKSRFLFAYSGHGMADGPTDNPTGYLLTSTAFGFHDKRNSINMSVLRVYLDQVIKVGYQTLILINACHSGAFLSPRPFGDETGRQPGSIYYLPKYGGAHAITSGGSNQLSWHDPNLGKGSVFFEKLLAGLGGQADMFPVYPDGHRGSGVITVDELTAYLRQEVSLATNQNQIPIPADLAPNRSLGGFFFLDRQRNWPLGTLAPGATGQVQLNLKASSANSNYPALLVQAALRDGNSLLAQTSDFKAVYVSPTFSHGLTTTTDPVQPGKVAQFMITVTNLTDSRAFSEFAFHVPKFTTYKGYPEGTASSVVLGWIAAGASVSANLDFKVLGGNQSPPDGSVVTLVLIDLNRGASVSQSIGINKAITMLNQQISE